MLSLRGVGGEGGFPPTPFLTNVYMCLSSKYLKPFSGIYGGCMRCLKALRCLSYVCCLETFLTLNWSLSFYNNIILQQTPFRYILWCYLPISSSVFRSTTHLSLSPCQRILRCGHTKLVSSPWLHVGRSSCIKVVLRILLWTSSLVFVGNVLILH